MRWFLLVCCVAGVSVIAALDGAVASPQFGASFDMRYGSGTPRTSTGLSTHMTWSDPGEPAGKPKQIERIAFRFHPGTRFDTAALPRCRASDAAVRDRGAAACPPSSRIGTGASKVNIGTAPVFGTQITLFNARRQLIVLVKAGALTITVFRDDVVGNALTVNLKIPTGFALTDLQVGLRAHTARRGGRRRSYFLTPATCPASAVWTTTATFTYVDGSSQQLTSTTPCAAG